MKYHINTCSKGELEQINKIILEECKCLFSSCIYNIDYNCTKKLDNISPQFMFEVYCPSKTIILEVKK